jgi:hypothetical protein
MVFTFSSFITRFDAYIYHTPKYLIFRMKRRQIISNFQLFIFSAKFHALKVDEDLVYLRETLFFLWNSYMYTLTFMNAHTHTLRI